MKKDKSDNIHWLEENKSHFDKVNEFAHEIDEQNQLSLELLESGQISTEPFKEITNDYLIGSQEKSWQDFTEAKAEAPIEELYERQARLSAELGKIAIKLSSIERKLGNKTRSIRYEEKIISNRIPELAPKIGIVAAKLIEQQLNKSKEKQGLETEKTTLELEQKTLLELCNSIKKSLETAPTLLSAEKIEEIEKSEDTIEIDHFPDEKDEKEKITKEQVAERVRKRYPETRLKDASRFVALFLGEVEGRIWTAQDLGDVLYPGREVNRKGPAAQLITNFENGQTIIIGKELDEMGLALQRGKREIRSKNTGKKIGNPINIYRSVPIDKVNDEEEIVRDGTNEVYINTGWIHVRPKKTKPRRTYKTKKEAVVPEADVKIPEPVQAVAPVETTVEEPAETKKPEKFKNKFKWEADFATDLIEAIKQFEEDGLMIEGLIRKSIVKTKSSSNNMGTKEMTERARRSKIITKKEAGDKDSVMPVSKYLCMYLQNQYGNVFSNRPSAKRAIEIAEKFTSDYFKNKAKLNK